MRGVNKVILVGTLGSDPELKYAANGNAIATISLATNEEWNDKGTGQKQTKTEWHRVVFFGGLADIVGAYLGKGSHIYIEGKLQTRKWQDQSTGADRYTTEVVVDGFTGHMEMLGGGQTAAGKNNPTAEQPQSQQNQYTHPSGQAMAPHEVQQANQQQR